MPFDLSLLLLSSHSAPGVLSLLYRNSTSWLPGGKRVLLCAEACMADMKDETRERTACRKDWDAANESIRAANWGAGNQSSPSPPLSTAQRNPIEGKKEAVRGLGKPGESWGGGAGVTGAHRPN
ncbi:hypothetical protein JOQ06_028442 [Pogonophryne albipinna]|uniref:Uncharacterized protein n=1 Tax=Pogonophryne albipinna TaxID=1090488 RepID=A0AAD6BA00_9TELE|nr:hypothetical protein JOQ06_028442 [Pogonophryne albipinna]